MNAMIFAAGLGTRLRPLTNTRPKALVEVNGKPLLEHVILKLKAAGITNIVVNVHHFGNQIIEFLQEHQNFGLNIQVSDERDLLLDTGGGLLHAFQLFNNDDPILVHNVDIASQLDFSQAQQQFANLASQQPALGALLLLNQRTTSRYLLFNTTNQLRGWINEKTGQTKGQVAPCKYAFTGIHIVTRALVPLLEAYNRQCIDAQPNTPTLQGVHPFPIIDFYLWACNFIAVQGLPLPEGCAWVDCGKPESLTEAAKILP